MNNVTLVELCEHAETFLGISNALNIMAYFVLPPLLIIFGLPMYFLALFCMYRQSRSTDPYMYQVMVISSAAVGNVFLILYVASYQWCGFYSSRCARIYAFVWFGSHTSYQVLDMSAVCRLMLALAMSADRLFGIWKPAEYKKLNRKLWRRWACALSVLIGFGSCIYDCFTETPVWSEEAGLYQSTVDETYLQSSLATFCRQFRNALRVAGLLTLLILNFGIISLYRDYVKSTSLFLSAKDAKAKAKERSIILLCVCQSTLTFVDVSLAVGYFLCQGLIPDFYPCWVMILAPIIDSAYQLIGVVELYLLMACSKSFRDVFKHIGWFGGGATKIDSNAGETSAVVSQRNQTTGVRKW